MTAAQPQQPSPTPPGRRGPFARGGKLGLVAGFASALLLTACVTGIGLRELGRSEDRLRSVVEGPMRKQALTGAMHAAERERTALLQRMLLADDPSGRDAHLLRFDERGAQFAAARREWLRMPLSPEERALLQRQGEATDRVLPLQRGVIELIQAGRSSEAQRLLEGRAIPAQDGTLSLLAELDAVGKRQAQQAVGEAEAAHRSARGWMAALSAASLMLGLLAAWGATRGATDATAPREHPATHDPLTGLPNRLLMLDRLQQPLRRARRSDGMLAVLYLDLDRLKLVNDMFGHAAGDELILGAARRFAAAVRAEDTVARIGGGEFVVIAADLDSPETAAAIAEKLLGSLLGPIRVAGGDVPAACSIGVAVFPDDGDDAETLLASAGAALHHAKESGGSRCQLFDAAMNARVSRRFQLESEMRRGLERDEFVVYFQPQLDLASGRIAGLEALVRWRHPQRGLLAPGEFLELAEHSGLIVAIGERTLRQACGLAARLRERGQRDLAVAVNLSGREFWSTDLIGRVRRALGESGAPPELLHLELSEAVLMQDADYAARRIGALRELGVRISVDDFGTGRSSLGELQRFALDTLKIDRTFVRHIAHRESDAAVADAILSLSRRMDLDVVAEGVENRAQLERLVQLGCMLVQGYLVSVPLAACEVLPFVERHDAGAWMRVPAGRPLLQPA